MDRPPFLAIDVGGTSTRAVVVTADGRCVGYGAAGSGNPTSSGPEYAATTITTAVDHAMARAGVARGAVGGAVAAIAGGRGQAGTLLHAELVRAGVAPALSFQPDLLATYLSGSLDENGYAVVSGTGAVAARIRAGRLDRICDGLGWLLGDGGSGFWLGQRVARAVTGALDGREPGTELVAALAADLGVATDLRAVVDGLYRLRPVELARFAPLAFAVASTGDRVAVAMVDAAGEALAHTAVTVASAEVDGPIVLGGSTLANQPSMRERVVAALRRTDVTGEVVVVADGVIGAAVLALRHHGVVVDGEVYARIGATLART